MNKETRSFIFGMFLLILCGLACAININNIYNGANYTLYDWILFVLSAIGFYYGLVMVSHNID